MGMYTEFFFRAELKEGPVADWFARCDSDDDFIEPFDDSDFFKAERWQYVLIGAGAVYQPTRGLTFARGDGYPDKPTLFIHSSPKNYGSEIDAFLEWVMPHVSAYKGDFLGYTLYEDSRTGSGYYQQDDIPDRDQPDLIFYPHAAVRRKEGL